MHNSLTTSVIWCTVIWPSIILYAPTSLYSIILSHILYSVAVSVGYFVTPLRSAPSYPQRHSSLFFMRPVRTVRQTLHSVRGSAVRPPPCCYIVSAPLPPYNKVWRTFTAQPYCDARHPSVPYSPDCICIRTRKSRQYGGALSWLRYFILVYTMSHCSVFLSFQLALFLKLAIFRFT